MLASITARLAGFDGLVTFNGKKFRERQPTTVNLVLDPEHNFTDWWQLSDGESSTNSSP